MPINITFSVKDYFVNSVSFKMNPSFDFHAPHRMTVEPVYSRNIVPLDKDNAKVELSIAIRETNTVLPFTLDATVSVNITSAGWDETPEKKAFIGDTGISILYPYLRALVTTVTGSMNYLPYTPPFMNIVAYINDQEKKTVRA